jgi:hypothetical protein
MEAAYMNQGTSVDKVCRECSAVYATKQARARCGVFLYSDCPVNLPIGLGLPQLCCPGLIHANSIANRKSTYITTQKGNLSFHLFGAKFKSHDKSCWKSMREGRL